ncbi:MAG: NAD(P)H-binding protein [Candidatus Eisenbacteria bacterium]|nr:NAD(P)H-binding protein [Candidatus Eisenbacteria bacterium]
MKAAVFGGTGRTGRLLLNEAAARKWASSVLVRDPTGLQRAQGITVHVGDARSLPDVTATIQGVNAVLCCLGMADVSKPDTDLSDCVKTIIRAMRDERVERIVSIASAGELDHPDGGYRNREGLPEYLRYVSEEHVRHYEALRDSGLRWTLMCPAFLKEDIPVGRGKIAFEDLPPGSYETGYADLAWTMADLVDEPESFGKRVGIVSFR